MPQRFRFGYQVLTGADLNVVDAGRRVEAAGFDIFLVSDHVGPGRSPLPQLAAVAATTSTLRIGTFVLNSDMRNPVQLAWEATVAPCCATRPGTPTSLASRASVEHSKTATATRCSGPPNTSMTRSTSFVPKQAGARLSSTHWSRSLSSPMTLRRPKTIWSSASTASHAMHSGQTKV